MRRVLAAPSTVYLLPSTVYTSTFYRLPSIDTVCPSARHWAGPWCSQPYPASVAENTAPVARQKMLDNGAGTGWKSATTREVRTR